MGSPGSRIARSGADVKCSDGPEVVRLGAERFGAD